MSLAIFSPWCAGCAIQLRRGEPAFESDEHDAQGAALSICAR